MKRAVELDPLSLVINSNLGWAYIHLGRLDEAIAQLRKTVEMDGGFYYARYALGLALELKGAIPEAIAEYQKAIAITEDPVPSECWAGFTLRRVEKMTRRKSFNSCASDESNITLRLTHWLWFISAWVITTRRSTGSRQGYQERDGFNIGPIRVDPLLTPLRGDPRFEALAEKIVPAREFSRDTTSKR
jgi:FOG: TPR repeat